MVDEGLKPGEGDGLDGVAAPGSAAGEASDTAEQAEHAPERGEVREARGSSIVGEVWQEGTPGHHVIKLRGLPASEAGVTIGRPDASNHSPSISDQKSAAGHVVGIGVAWTESAVGDDSGTGRIMWQSFRAPGGAVQPPANDNATWVTGPNGIGAFGSEPTIAGLNGGDTLITWIGADDSAHGRLYAYPLAAPAGSDGVEAPEHATANAAMADLGPVAAAPDGGRRLQAVETRPGTFAIMWLALADSGLTLRGSLFLSTVGPGLEDSPADWTEHPIADIRLPSGFTGEFSVAGAGGDSADLVVTYTELDEAGAASAFARRIDGSGPELGQPGPEYQVGTAPVLEGKNAIALVAAQSDTAAQSPSTDEGSADQVPPKGSHDDAAVTSFTIAAEPGIKETAPLVTAVVGGFAIAWQAPSAAETALQIKLVLYDSDGVPKGPEILVTDNAAADVAPAIVGFGDGIAAAYVHGDDRALAVKAYDGDGIQIGEETVVDTGSAGAIVDIAIAANSDDELAVVYVQASSDATDGNAGYGNIMLQRYAVETADSHSHLVGLGRDGAHDGSDDPVQLTTENDGDPATTEVAVGRAPAVAGVDDGELAIIWVESDGTRETIKGCAIGRDGEQALYIDLTDFLQDTGIARGTVPTLLATADGDFLVSWLQSDGDGGRYVVMAAFYDEVGAGEWMKPQEAIRLKSFDSEPKDYSVAVSSDDDGLFINVVWEQESSGSGGGDDRILSQRYDIDGHRLGGATSVAGANSLSGEQPSDSLAAVGLLDGQVIVAYAEHRSDGDVDLVAHVIDASTGETVTSGPESANASGIGDSTFSTSVDQEIAIDVLANGSGGLTIARINDVAITTATPVDVGFGWVQLRDDGWLTVSPDAGYTGPIAFDYTVAGGGTGANGRVTVNVEANEASAAVTLVNQVDAVVEDVPADLKVADIAVTNGELSADGLSLAGLDAGMFKIVGSALYLKAGAELDFEAKPTLSVDILANRTSDPDWVATFTLSVEGTNEATTNDTFIFVPSFGGGEHERIDLSFTGYETFQELMSSGALVQAGEDVVITLAPDDPAGVHKITLKGVELSALSDTDFKFS